MAKWNDRGATRVAFFLDNGFVANLDFSVVSLENPGCGGTEFEFYKICYLIEKHSADIAPVLLLRHAVDDNYCPVEHAFCESAEDAYTWAEKNHCTHIIFRAFFCPPKNQERAVKIYSWMHNGATACQIRQFDKENRPDGFIFVSKYQYMTSSRYVKNKSFLCRNALSGRIMEGPIDSSHKKSIAYIGRPTESLHFDKVLFSFAKVRQKHPDMSLIVYGIEDLFSLRALTDYEKRILNIVNNLGIPRSAILFRGRIPTLQMDKELKDVLFGFANPGGAQETFCISATDFARNGVIPIVPNAGPFLELVPKKCGCRIVRLDSVPKILERIINKPHRILKMSNANTKHMKSILSDAIIAGEWDDFFHRRRCNKTSGLTRCFFSFYYSLHLILRRLVNRKHSLREY